MKENDLNELNEKFKKYKNNTLHVLACADSSNVEIAWFAVNGTDDDLKLDNLIYKDLMPLLKSYIKVKTIVRCTIKYTVLDTKIKMDIISKKSDYDSEVNRILDDALKYGDIEKPMPIVENIITYNNDISRAKELFNNSDYEEVRRNWTCCERKIIGFIFAWYRLWLPEYESEHIIRDVLEGIEMFVTAPPCCLCLPSLYRIKSTIYYRKPKLYELSVKKLDGGTFKFNNKLL